MPGFSVDYQLLELAETHVHQVGDSIQPSYPLSSPSTPHISCIHFYFHPIESENESVHHSVLSDSLRINGL